MGTLSDTVANNILNAATGGAAFSIAQLWTKLHLGDPGSAGANNAAANTTRKQGTFGSGAAGRSIAITAVEQWTSVPNAEVYLWVSFWDASVAGNFLGRAGPFTGGTVNVGDTFTVPIGNLTLAII